MSSHGRQIDQINTVFILLVALNILGFMILNLVDLDAVIGDHPLSPRLSLETS